MRTCMFICVSHFHTLIYIRPVGQVRLFEASLGLKKGCIRVWARSDRTMVSMAADIPIELLWENCCDHSRASILNRIVFILAGNEDNHKISDD